jgi:hypothetical protein
VFTGQLDGFFTVARLRDHVIAGLSQHLSKVEPDKGFVLGDQDATTGRFHGHARRSSLLATE